MKEIHSSGETRPCGNSGNWELGGGSDEARGRGGMALEEDDMARYGVTSHTKERNYSSRRLYLSRNGCENIMYFMRVFSEEEATGSPISNGPATV